MFEVTFVLNIFDAEVARSDVRFAVLQRQSTLPFVPVVGHSISWERDPSRKLTSVTWNVHESVFICKVADEFPDNISLDGMDFEELVEHTQSRGWELIRIFERQP
ncbi:hypothetical protein [Comamonas fluminis]|uniref:hypothetical protein n=1 Tax=Comamonas fluminis TaxID=2796366 RepID=UPI001C441648|nr:hypothetical protein [Comamonas fluminis]